MRRLFAAFALLFAAATSFAHPAPFSFLDIEIDTGGIHGALVIHDFDAAHELGLEKPDALLDSSLAPRYTNDLTRLIDSRLNLTGLTLTGDHPFSPKWGEIEVLSERQSLRLPFSLDATAPDALRIEATLFPYDAKHQTFINVYENGELKHQTILDAGRTTTRYFRGTPQGRWAVIKTFVQAGVHHIMIGIDHVLFLIGLLLLGGTWRRLALIVTAFTVGHSVTLSLAALDIVRIPSTLIEPAIALSIVVVGSDALLANRERQKTSRPSRDLRPWLAGAFGLIHGFGFAAVLSEFGLPREALGWSLGAFNLGVEIGQLIVVAIALLLGSIVMKALARAQSASRLMTAERFLTIGSVAVIVAGVYWFVERLMFLSRI